MTTYPKQRPVLLLDVDGVLVTQNEVAPSRGQVYKNDPHRFYYPHHGWLLPLLIEQTDARYMTAHANPHDDIGTLLGLPALPRIEYTNYQDGAVDEQAAAVDDLFSGRPVAWIDDNHAQPGRLQWAARRADEGMPTLLIQPQSEYGLHGEHIASIKRWIGGLALPYAMY